MMNLLQNAFRLIALLSILTASASAQEVLLTLTGSVTGGQVDVTRDDLVSIIPHEFATSTSVGDGRPLFKGVLMRDVLAFAGAEGDSVRATALNDYVVDIPIKDFYRFDVLAALSMNGEALTARDKGPIWIVYPRDDHPELADIRYDIRWVWQLVTLHVK